MVPSPEPIFPGMPGAENAPEIPLENNMEHRIGVVRARLLDLAARTSEVGNELSSNNPGIAVHTVSEN